MGECTGKERDPEPCSSKRPGRVRVRDVVSWESDRMSCRKLQSNSNGNEDTSEKVDGQKDF